MSTRTAALSSDGPSGAILEQCVEIVAEFPARHAFVLSEPIHADVLEAASGSTGGHVSVHRHDGADAACRLLHGRFEAAGVDVIRVREATGCVHPRRSQAGFIAPQAAAGGFSRNGDDRSARGSHLARPLA